MMCFPTPVHKPRNCIEEWSRPLDCRVDYYHTQINTHMYRHIQKAYKCTHTDTQTETKSHTQTETNTHTHTHNTTLIYSCRNTHNHIHIIHITTLILPTIQMATDLHQDENHHTCMGHARIGHLLLTSD